MHKILVKFRKSFHIRFFFIYCKKYSNKEKAKELALTYQRSPQLMHNCLLEGIAVTPLNPANLMRTISLICSCNEATVELPNNLLFLSLHTQYMKAFQATRKREETNPFPLRFWSLHLLLFRWRDYFQDLNPYFQNQFETPTSWNK